jgi:tyrosyl-DNA phosphodiesterase 2
MATDEESPFSPEALKKILSAPPATRRSDTDFYKPRDQPFYGFDGSQWSKDDSPSSAKSNLTTSTAIRLITWNIDMLIPFAVARMAVALNYLSSIATDEGATPTIIVLQEMTRTDLKQIQGSQWIRDRYYVTDIDNREWLHPAYGTTTLVDRRLTIRRVFRVPFVSKFDRDGLFVDVALSPSGTNAGGPHVLRIMNAHLESLVADPPVRPVQLADAAPYLQAPEVYAGLLAGDCNAIQPFDRTLHSENGLKDAYLELGGQEDADEGYTWGIQVKKEIRERFGPSRMDKVMFCGNIGARSMERIGVGIGVEEEPTKSAMESELEGNWVTDHFGLAALLEMERGLEIIMTSHLE